MDIKLLGYSERGMMNALADDIHHSTDPTSTLSEFLSWFDFPMTDSPPCFQDIENATLLVEQSFSDFGDLDLLILLEHRDKRRQAILIEAKVSNDTNSWRTVEDRWDEFTQMLNGGEGTTSNLFVQLHRKVRMVKFLLSKKDGYEPDIFTPRGSQGTNQVVGRAIELVREYIGDGNVWYGAILPDETGELDAFASETLRSSHVDQSLNTWDSSRWGLLSWHAINAHAIHHSAKAWPRINATFEWNKGQIFRNTPPVQHSIIARQAYLLDNQLVYVVSNRQVRECRIVRINGTDNGYFWRTELVEVYKLSPSEGGFNIGLMPTLPQKGMEYEWDCQNEPHWLPDKTLNEVKCGDRLIVVYPSWFTTRVRQAGNSGDASEFLVYTYHLKRS